MGTWVKCPECIQNLPRKYQSKRERKEVHEATCNSCKNKDARKKYEIGVKRGIWLKKWDRAENAFKKAMDEFKIINDTKSMLTVELMGLFSRLYGKKNKKTAQEVINTLISNRFEGLLDEDFYLPEFGAFMPFYFEAKCWFEFLKINSIENLFDKTNQMKKTVQLFLNLEYGPLFFSSYIIDKKLTNVELGLNLEAESEEILGLFYADIGDIENASIHLNNAAQIYLNIDQPQKAKSLKMIRQSLRMETACWICGTRSKGHRQTFNFKYTGLSENHFDRVLNLLKQRQERNPTFHENTIYTTSKPITVIQQQDVKEKENKKGIYLSTCTVCQGLFDELSRDVVKKELIPVWDAIHSLENSIKQLINAINAMQAQINSLASMAHTHSSY
ncbi:MAG: hypothetical protein ACTSRH_07255 [Promethearchaeota archaeon]